MLRTLLKPTTSPRTPRNTTRILCWFIISDCVALIGGFIISQCFMMQAPPCWRFPVIGVGILLWFASSGHYRTRMPFWMEMQKIVIAIFCAMIINAFLLFPAMPSLDLFLRWIFVGALIIALRSVMRLWLERKGLWQVRTIITGAGITAKRALHSIRSERRLGYVIVAQIKNIPSALKKSGGSWQTLCAQHRADYIIIAEDGVDLTCPLRRLVKEDIPFSIIPPFGDLSTTGVAPLYFFNHSSIMLTRNNRLAEFMPRLIKRTFDLCVSVIGLILLSPFMLGIALLIKQDGGSVFYQQKRPGFNGKLFSIYKFRSMCVGADKKLNRYLNHNANAMHDWQIFSKLKTDPRITKLGLFLRHYSIDELPQLWNVIKGDMSLVGPRAILPHEITMRSHWDMGDYYKVLPGITGLWQVSGRNNTSYATRISMDNWYVRNWSLWQDITILCKTIPALVNRQGAY